MATLRPSPEAEALGGELRVRMVGEVYAENAMAAAREEVGFARDLCADVPINTVFTVRRVLDEAGDVREEFRQISPPTGEVPHARIWGMEPDDA